MKNLSRTLLAVAFLVLVAACSAPVHNVVSEPVLSQRDVTREEVKKAIISAGTGLRRKMTTPRGRSDYRTS